MPIKPSPKNPQSDQKSLLLWICPSIANLQNKIRSENLQKLSVHLCGSTCTCQASFRLLESNKLKTEMDLLGYVGVPIHLHREKKLLFLLINCFSAVSVAKNKMVKMRPAQRSAKVSVILPKKS